MFLIKTVDDARYFVNNIEKFSLSLNDGFRHFGFHSSMPGERTYFDIRIYKDGIWKCRASSQGGYEIEFDIIDDPVSFVSKYKKGINSFLRNSAKDEYLSKLMPDIFATFTAPEAAHLWGLDESTVKRACQQGRFIEEEARKSGGTWLVTQTGMERLYGPRPTGEKEEGK